MNRQRGIEYSPGLNVFTAVEATVGELGGDSTPFLVTIFSWWIRQDLNLGRTDYEIAQGKLIQSPTEYVPALYVGTIRNMEF